MVHSGLKKCISRQCFPRIAVKSGLGRSYEAHGRAVHNTRDLAFVKKVCPGKTYVLDRQECMSKSEVGYAKQIGGELFVSSMFAAGASHVESKHFVA